MERPVSTHVTRFASQAFSVIAVLAFASVLMSCGHAPLSPREEPAATRVWPEAPEKPRIRYVQEIRRAEDLLPRSPWWRRALSGLLGGRDTRLVRPHGLAVDAGGRLYVADSALRQVHVFDPAAGRYHRFPKHAIEGFVQPLGVAVARDGRVLVTDPVAGAVHVFSDQGRTYLGVTPGGGDGGIFRRPTGIAVAPGGEVLVLDTLASALVVLDGDTLAEMERVGEHSGEAHDFHYPTSVAVSDRGDIYVADTLNFRVQSLTAAREFSKAFGEAGGGPGGFSRPKAVAVDSERHVYVVDSLFDNVQIFNTKGQPLLAFGGSGSGPGELWLPNAILIDPNDRIYISDPHNHRVQVFRYLKEDRP